MDSLLERQARFTFHDEMQQTPLHLAAQYGMFAHVEALARRVASGLNERDDKGRTPLHNAAINGHRLAILIKSVSIFFLQSSTQLCTQYFGASACYQCFCQVTKICSTLHQLKVLVNTLKYWSIVTLPFELAEKFVTLF